MLRQGTMFRSEQNPYRGFSRLPTAQGRLASYSSMEAKLQASVETIANLIYLIRVSANDPVATTVYLDLAEAQLRVLADRLEDCSSRSHSVPD
jgi:hypothetical protein